MSQPTPYERSYSFSDFSSGSPTSQPPGQKIDAELDAIAQTTGGVLDSLALIQRDDGRLANDSVGVDQLSDAALALIASDSFVVRGAWVTAHSYVVGDMISSAGTVYLCMIAHTSGVLLTDVTAGRFVKIFDPDNLTLAASLALSTGAAAIGSTGGITVQAALNLKASLATLAANGGAALVGTAAGVTVEAALALKASLATLAASGGSANLGTLAAGTGATARTQEAVNRDTVSGKGYGAAGDGSALDGPALQLAIDAVIALGGGEVHIPAGIYKAHDLAVTGYTGRGLRIVGHGAEIRLSAGQTGLAITDSQNVTVEGLKFKSAVTLDIGALDLTLIGILVTNSSRITLKCSYENLTYGEQWYSTLTTTILGRSIPMPSRTSPVAKGCVTGVYFAPTAQYIECHNGNVTECLIYGLTSEGGNNKVIGGNYVSNQIGIYWDGAASGNGDHGAIVGATINHNIKCNVWLHSLDYSMLVTGCNIWACIDGQAIVGDPDFALAIGLLLTGCKNTMVIGNAIARNGVNLAHNGPTYSRIAYNSFQADSANTTYNIKSSSALPSTSQITGNTFEGALVAAADNNDPEKWITPTLLNSWVNFGGSHGGAKYRVLENRILELSGRIKDGGAVPSIAFTVPAIARPTVIRCVVAASNGAYGDVEVDTSGNVSVKNGSATWVSLDNLRIALD